MLYRVGRIRVVAAARVGLMGGILLGGVGGLLIPFCDVIVFTLTGLHLLYKFFWVPGLSIFIMSPLLGIVGIIFGAVGGALLLASLAFLYNLTLPLTGGLLVELKPLPKRKNDPHNSND